MSLISIDWNPGRSKLREFAWIWLVAFGVIGTVSAWKIGCFSGDGSWAVPVILWSLAGSIGIAGLLAPVAVRPVYLIWMGLSFPFGWLLSHLFLAVIYFGLFAPMAILFRLLGRDSLDRKFDKRADSYWVKRNSTTSMRRYYQKF